MDNATKQIIKNAVAEIVLDALILVGQKISETAKLSKDKKSAPTEGPAESYTASEALIKLNEENNSN